jgi:hypothetical protein
MAREHAKAVAMAMDGEIRATPQRLYRREAGPVQADHDA